MKKILGLLLAAACCACSDANRDDIVVNFVVDNMTYSKVGLIVDRSTSFVVDLDKDGKATLVIPGMEDLYVHVAYGQSTKDVFLEKGRKTTVRFDARSFNDGVQVDGVNAPAAEYLQTVTLPEPPSYELAWEEYAAGLDKCVEEGVRLVKARKLDEKCPHFAAVEQERIRYYYAQGLIMYPLYRQLGADPDYRPGKEYYDAVRSLVAEREELADVDVYRNFLNFGVSTLLQEQNPQRLDPYARTIAAMKYMAENFSNEKVKQTMLRVLAMEYLGFSGVRNTKELRALVDTYITDPRMLKEVRDEFARLDPKAVGRPSPDFTAQDADGNSYSLGDFRGKYLLIDMWATWCGPCKAELPHLKALEKKFEGRNIAFLGLSVDKDRDAWEQMVRSGGLAGTQLLLGPGSEFQQDYGIEGIPHFILLDKEGKIVNANMIRPSSEDAERILNQLEGI